MPRNKGQVAKKKRQAKRNAVDDVYEHPEEKEEDYSRTDIDGVYEYEVPDRIKAKDDEEIDEETAFNSEDEENFGLFFSKVGKNSSNSSDEEIFDDEDLDNGEGGMLLSDLLTEGPQPILAANENEKLDDEEYSEEDENSEEDNSNHDKLLSFMGTIIPKNVKMKKKQVTESVAESEFSKRINSGEKLSMSALLGESDETLESQFSSVKKQLSSLEKQSSTLHAPLAPVQEERIARKVAYQEKKKDMKKFDAIVRENENKRTLDFTIQTTKIPMTTSGSLTNSFKPESELEQKVSNLLKSSGMSSIETLKDEEDELERKQCTKEEILERQAKLAKMRSLMFFQEKKQKRIKKIKSKLYHKIRNRQEKRLLENEQETRRQIDPEYANKLDEENAEKRAEERMTLKHMNTSKWVQHQIKRGINADQNSRIAIAEQLQRSEDLRKKMESMNDSQDEDEFSSDDENEDALTRLERKLQNETQSLVLDSKNPLPQTKGLHGMKFMQKAAERQRELAREEAEKLLEELKEENKLSDISSSDEKKNNLKETKKTNKKKKILIEEKQSKISDLSKAYKAKVSSVIAVDLGEENKSNNKEIVNNSNVSNFSKELITEDQSQVLDNPWLTLKTTNKKRKKDNNRKNEAIMDLNITKVVDNLTINKAENIDMTIWEKENQRNKAHENLVQEAFACAEDIEKEIQDEKEKAADYEAEVKTKKEIAKMLSVPGWGGWAGEGVRPSKQAKIRQEAANEAVAIARENALKKRKDREMSKVVLNEKKDKKLAKFTCNTVPYPFTSRREYELAMRNPLGSDWNTVASTSSLTQPQVKTKAGAIIAPIKVKNQSKNRKGKF